MSKIKLKSNLVLKFHSLFDNNYSLFDASITLSLAKGGLGAVIAFQPLYECTVAAAITIVNIKGSENYLTARPKKGLLRQKIQ
ncbi:MAG: hypothetical protein ACJAXS_001461 [Colwellia sp.]